MLTRPVDVLEAVGSMAMFCIGGGPVNGYWDSGQGFSSVPEY